MPKLSIIMPVYNSEVSHLAEAISSIIVAAPRDSEIHIGLDGPCSEPGLQLLHIMQQSRPRPIIRISQFQRQGLVSTLNALIEQSDCQYLARQDSDDVCLPSRLKQQLRALDARATAHFCGTQVARCDANLQPHRHQRIYPTSFRSQLIYASLLNNPIAHPTLMIRRNVLGSPTYQHVSGAEDWDLYIRLWREGKQSFNLKQTGLLYRIHPNQITQQARNSKLLYELKSRSLQAAIRHYNSSRLLKPIQILSSAIRLTEVAILAKRWIDR
jgi:glycosyltransferase involved in cell wall biosynthesis